MFHKYYDKIYSGKDYNAEVDFILSMVDYRPKTVLDVGCGTGNHTIQFLKKGFNVYGIDTDEKMIEKAIAKNSMIFRCCDIYNLKPPHTWFNLTVAMFNVVNYIENVDSLYKFFRAVNYVTRDYFVFDCWNGLATILDNPKKINKEINNIKVSIEPETSLMDQTVRVKNIIYVDGIEFEYVYNQTLWTPKILKDVLMMAGFKSVQILKWMEDQTATEKEWRIIIKCS